MSVMSVMWVMPMWVVGGVDVASQCGNDIESNIKIISSIVTSHGYIWSVAALQWEGIC